MTEFAAYGATPASLGAVPDMAWVTPPLQYARDRSGIAPMYTRTGTWKFRSIRQPSAIEPVAAPEPLVLSSSQRIHLRKIGPAPDAPGGTVVKPAFAAATAAHRPERSPLTLRIGPDRVSTMDIYTAHFGLTARPFTLVPDPGFLFWSTQHQHAYAMLEYGILTRAPITLITGEIGAGKTTLIHQLLRTVGTDAHIGLVSNTHGSPEQLLQWVLLALGQPSPKDATYPGLVAAFQDFLLAEYTAGKRVILIFDEAQNLQAEALEELRILTNVNSSRDELLQLVLVGQPELRNLVHLPDMHQFAQRVAASFHLTAMDAETVRAYIAHRLSVAGLKSNIFSQAATDLVFEATGGIPRRVNQLCDLSMVYAFTNAHHNIFRSTVQQVLDDGTFFGAKSVNRMSLEFQ